LRAVLTRARRSSTPSASAQSARVSNALRAAEGHRIVATYASVGDEPDTLRLINELHAGGVRVLLPVLAQSRTPTWGFFDGELVPGFRGIPEPANSPLGADALGQASFILTSALAVTPRGYRLGTGGGWWDRALLHARPDAVVAVLVNDDEVVEGLPVDEWDVPVDLIVTETRILPTNRVDAPSPTTG
jgi:5-formyltetrahydrofolate cyclo-ligase